MMGNSVGIKQQRQNRIKEICEYKLIVSQINKTVFPRMYYKLETFLDLINSPMFKTIKHQKVDSHSKVSWYLFKWF